jgi:hypothetical protein
MMIRKALVISGLALLAFNSLQDIARSSKSHANRPQITDGTDPMPRPSPRPPKTGKASLAAVGHDFLA